MSGAVLQQADVLGIAAAAAVVTTPPSGALFGLVLSKSAATTVGVAAGSATDSTNATKLAIAAFTKTFSAFTAGTGLGGLDTGAKANSTWYHVFLISTAAGALTDILISLSATAPTMPSTYTLFRRLGAIKTDGSGNILAFSQLGDQFLWDTHTLDVALVTSISSATLETLNVPTGIKVHALISVLDSGTTGIGAYLTSPDAADIAPDASTAFNIVHSTTLTSLIQPFTIRTNTSGQIRYRASSAVGSIVFNIRTFGWIDDRGRSA